MNALEIAFYIITIILSIIAIWLAWRQLKKKSNVNQQPQMQHQEQKQTVNIILPSIQPKEQQTDELVPEVDVNTANSASQKDKVNSPVPIVRTIQPTPTSLGRKRSTQVLKNKKKDEVVQNFIDEIIEIPAGGHARINKRLEKGDILEGLLEEIDNFNFNYYLMDLANYVKYKNGGKLNFIDGDSDQGTHHINLIIPESGEWWLILDAYGKQYDREVHVKLDRRKKQL